MIIKINYRDELVANLFNWTLKTAKQMQLKTIAGLAIFVLLFGITSTSMMHSADAAYSSSDAKAQEKKDTAKAKADAAKAKAQEKKDTAKAKADTAKASAGTSNVAVSMAQGASAPGCDTTNSCYNPSDAKVSVGGKVTWKNDDKAAHTVTSGVDATPDGKFDSSLISPGKTFSFAFKESGTINYYCSLHPWMKGTVTVS